MLTVGFWTLCIVFLSKSFVYSLPPSVSVFIGSDHKDAWAAQHVADADRLPIALIHSNPPVDQYDDVTCIFTEL